MATAEHVSLVQAFWLACEFMYTGKILEIKDAEVAMNLWMIAGSLQIHGLPAYALQSVTGLLTQTETKKIPDVVRQAIAAWQLGEALGQGTAGDGYWLLKSTIEFVLCDLQVRSSRETLSAPATFMHCHSLGVAACV